MATATTVSRAGDEHVDSTGMIGISLMVYLFMRDTKADSAMHRHE